MMNKILLSLILLPFILKAQPLWFYNINPKENEIIGYGVSTNLYEAKKYAIDEISKTLNLNIKSSYDLKKSYEKDSLIKKDISSNINISSNSKLENINFINVKKIDELWYVAALYDNSTITQKIKRTFKGKILKDEKQNSYLEKTPLILSINQVLTNKLDFKLVRKNRLWYLSYENKLFYLNQDNFYNLFVDYNNDISIKTNKITYKDNEQIKIQINLDDEAFISLFNIQFDGKVGCLMQNIKIKDELILDKFKTINPYPYQIQEQFIVIKTDKPLNLNSFSVIDNNLLDLNDFKLDRLLEIIDNNSFSSKTIKIKKGYEYE